MSTTRYFRSAAGAYLGAFGPGVPAPPGGIEVPRPPVDGRAGWARGGWAEPPPRPWRVLKSTLVQRMSDDELASYLALLGRLPPRDRAMWDAVRYIASDDALVRHAAERLGWPAERIDELLGRDPHPDAQGDP